VTLITIYFTTQPDAACSGFIVVKLFTGEEDRSGKSLFPA
jgi:hypothetical protein